MVEKDHEISNLIDLKKSYIFFRRPKNTNDTQWRVDIDSVLINENEKKTYYLVKECRGEGVGENPFKIPSHHYYEFLSIVEKYRNHYIIRTSSVSSKGTMQKTSFEGIEVIEKLSNIKILGSNEVFETLVKRNKENIYCKINFEFNKTNFSIIAKCKFINFSHKYKIGNKCKDCEFDEHDYNCRVIQPTTGYVPFVLNENIYVSYLARYSCKKMDGNLEFLLRVGSPIFDYRNNAFVRNIIKFVLNKLLFFIKKNEFQERISVEKSNIVYFKYC